jgi:hypothetical protein
MQQHERNKTHQSNPPREIEHGALEVCEPDVRRVEVAPLPHERRVGDGPGESGIQMGCQGGAVPRLIRLGRDGAEFDIRSVSAVAVFASQGIDRPCRKGRARWGGGSGKEVENCGGKQGLVSGVFMG